MFRKYSSFLWFNVTYPRTTKAKKPINLTKCNKRGTLGERKRKRDGEKEIVLVNIKREIER